MRWDIFCQIVDNYGDAGICWRLARSLTSIYGQGVRIFCDDLPTLNLIASGTDAPVKAKIDLQPWEASHQNARHGLKAPDIVIEAFGCDLPERYLASLLIAPKKPIIINLEYLSAESWVVDFHAKGSPQSHGLSKYFFFPGFQENVGGLLLDPIPATGEETAELIPENLKEVWSKLRPLGKKVSVFCYPGAPLKLWLEDLAAEGKEIDVILTYGQAEILNPIADRKIDLPTNLNILSIPFVSQDEYDWVLSQCDFNIVRGEDSFIRAQLAGKPFVWHIYPQKDKAHEVKLAAFLELYLENTSLELRLAVIAAMAWAMPSQWQESESLWKTHALAWRNQLLEKQADGGLPARLMAFVV
uniref:elongation factor P maturation arginine rhamnosyltransferase EarP n=1 Tax=Polynucleobacter sp. TaxID=2029855 RepID=UPI0040483EA0